MTTLQIDIVSDIACPWCAIGYARLEHAMKELADELDFDVEWHAFELNPDKASDGEPIGPALSRKYGASEKDIDHWQQEMISIAHGLGLDFTHMQKRCTRNTFNAHRLVAWAREQGCQTAMNRAFFDAYFGRAEDISDDEVLVRCAESIGLNGDEARRVLDSGDYADAVLKDEARYQNGGISAVPAYIINQQYLISGAQPPEYLVNTLRDIAAGRVQTQ